MMRRKMILPRKAILKMDAYNPPLEGRKGKLRLDFNENTTGCSPKVIGAIRKATAEDISMYPEYKQTTVILAKYLKVKPSQIMLTNGSDEAIRLVIQTYLESGDKVLMPVPSYTMYKVYAQMQGCVIEEVPYNDDFSFPLGSIVKKAGDGSKLIILANPNNPTGTVLSRANLRRLLGEKRKSIVVLDEAYTQYLGRSDKDLVSKYPNLIIIQTFSKAFGLAGLRIGTLISNQENISQMKKAQSPYSVNTISLIALKAALGDKRYINNYARSVAKAKACLASELKKLGIRTYPSGGNFIVAEFGIRCEEICDKLRTKGILIRDRSQEKLLSGCVRITAGTVRQSRALVKALKEILQQPTLIFDMDGVLVDESKSYLKAIKRTVRSFANKEVPARYITAVKASGKYNNDWECTQKILKMFGAKAKYGDVVKTFQKYYIQFRDNEKLLISAITLEALSRKYALAIATGRPRKEAEYTLKKFNAERYFQAIICMDEAKPKPSPDSIIKLKKMLLSSKAVYFGDSIADAIAAGKAKAEFVGILPTQNRTEAYKKLLYEEGAKAVLTSINQIFKVIK